MRDFLRKAAEMPGAVPLALILAGSTILYVAQRTQTHATTGSCVELKARSDTKSLSIDHIVADFNPSNIFEDMHYGSGMDYLWVAYDSNSAGRYIGTLEKSRDISNFLRGDGYDFFVIYDIAQDPLLQNSIARVQKLHGALYYSLFFQESMTLCTPGTDINALREVWDRILITMEMYRNLNRQRPAPVSIL